ncbi:MAG: hypothetical protein P4N59_03470 [Negativicutes bacterium]|nr:hypothetical protein [Negativicutes bacterium]
MDSIKLFNPETVKERIKEIQEIHPQMGVRISITTDHFEHLLNCLCNQKYITEQSPEVQADWQERIDAAWNDGMALLSRARNMAQSTYRG